MSTGTQTRLRLFFTFLLSMILLIAGNLMYSNNAELSSNELASMFVIATFATFFYWLVWELELRWRKRNKIQEFDAHSIEKRKRDRLDNVLRDLSNDELYRLRERLSTVDDIELEDRLLANDGELLTEQDIR